MAVLLSNNATGRLGGSINAAQTSISLMSGDGAKFPSPTGGDWFPLTVVNAAGDLEIMRCTARSGDTLTVLRGQEGTIGLPFSVGDRAELRLTKSAISELQDEKLAKSANLSDLSSAATARQNLGLGTAATRDVGTGAGNVVLVEQVNNHGKPAGQFNAVANSSDSWNLVPNTSLKLSSINNALAFLVSGTVNDRKAIIQSGHSDLEHANALGELRLNPFGGTVTINNNTALHTGNILSTTGQSTKYPMTQKAVTDAINNSAIGVGQTWQNVSLSDGVNYTNTTGRTIVITIATSNTYVDFGRFYVDGVIVARQDGISGSKMGSSDTVLVPPGSTYSFTGYANYTVAVLQ